MKFSIPYIVIVLSATCGNLFCQDRSTEYQLKTYTTEHGLPHNVIYNISRDSTGFLWLATWDGLSRFDGNEFKNYRHDPDDPNSLPFFIPSKVVTDRLNNVWILTNSRPVYVYDRAADNFRPGLEGFYQDARASDLTSDKSGNIWIALDSVLLRYDPATGEPDALRVIKDSLMISGMRFEFPHITFDNRGNLWYSLTGDSEIEFYNGIISGDTVFLRFAGLLSLQGFESLPLRTGKLYPEIYVSDSGISWLSCRYGIFWCDTVTGKFVSGDMIDKGQIEELPFLMWFEEKAGIKIRKPGEGHLVRLPVTEGDYVECVYAYRSGTIWSANINRTLEHLGLNRYTPVPPWFTHYLDEPDADNSHNIVFPVLRDRHGELWVGMRNHTRLHRIKPDGSETFFSLPPDKTGGDVPHVRCMAEDESGIWFGTTDGRLFYYRFESRSARQEYPQPGSDEKNITGIHNILDDGNSLVINGNKGVFRFDKVTHSPQLCYNHPSPGTGFSLVKDGKGGFWLGSWGSLVIHLDQALQETGRFRIGDGENLVEHICPGDSSDIWVALMGGGLGHFFPETGQTEILTTADGLPNNVTYSILRDNKGCLWISTNEGLSMFNPATHVFRNYGRTEGLKITEFNSDSFFKTRSGEMYFGGIGGVVRLFPDSIEENQGKAGRRALAVTGLKVSGIGFQMGEAPYETDIFRLRRGDNNFQATITLFDLDAPEKVMYRYRLHGRDNDWIVTGHRNPVISYANLTHKDYRLEMEATNELGEWAFRKEITVSIPHRFFELPIVRITLLMIGLFSVVFALIYYLRHQRLKERQLLDSLRLESLRSQMNPHFVFNSLSSINYFISKEDRIAANEYIADFSRLIRSIIDNTGEDFVTLDRELQSLADYLKLEHLRFGDRFTYSVSSEKILSPEEVRVFPGMIQPFVENAIWHGVRNLAERKGHISVVLGHAGPERLRCTIEDDGIGRKKATVIRGIVPGHRSRGIELVSERLRIYNAMTRRDYKIIIEDLYPEREDTGTRVTVDLPAGIKSLS